MVTSPRIGPNVERARRHDALTRISMPVLSDREFEQNCRYSSFFTTLKGTP